METYAINFTVNELKNVLEQTSNMCLVVAKELRKGKKFKRNEYVFYHYVIAFAVKEKYIAVHCPLIVYKRDIRMMYQPLIQPITQDHYLDIISNKNI
jgi:hypothetical protein